MLCYYNEDFQQYPDQLFCVFNTRVCFLQGVNDEGTGTPSRCSVKSKLYNRETTEASCTSIIHSQKNKNTTFKCFFKEAPTHPKQTPCCLCFSVTVQSSCNIGNIRLYSLSSLSLPVSRKSFKTFRLIS